MTSLIIRGKFIKQYFESAAAQLGITLLSAPPADDYASVAAETDPTKRQILLMKAAWQEIDFANEYGKNGCIGYVYFPDWVFPIHEYIHEIQIPKVFWNLEDPNHFKSFWKQAEPADIILTSASELMSDYQGIFQEKQIGCLTWAADPTYHFPRIDDPMLKDREFDIVFVGNRYPNVEDRVVGEREVLIPAIKWARENNKKMGVWGMGNVSPQSWRFHPVVWPDVKGIFPYDIMDDNCLERNPDYAGVYQSYTGSMEAPNIYRKARVVLAMNEQTLSPTMCSMRTYEAAACGNIVLSHWSKATENIFGGTVITSHSSQETIEHLNNIFFGASESPNPEYVDAAVSACDLVMKNHTYLNRLNTLVRMIFNFSKGE